MKIFIATYSFSLSARKFTRPQVWATQYQAQASFITYLNENLVLFFIGIYSRIVLFAVSSVHYDLSHSDLEPCDLEKHFLISLAQLVKDWFFQTAD